MGEPLKIRTTRAEKYPRIDNWDEYNATMERVFGNKPRKPGRTVYKFVDGKFMSTDEIRAAEAAKAQQQ